MKLLTTLLLATLAALILAFPTTSNNAANVLNARDECDICHDKEAECRAVSSYPTSNRLPSGVLTRYYLVLLLLVEPTGCDISCPRDVCLGNQVCHNNCGYSC
jgi:hypothetical protein